jgi:hypothetical protein
VFFRSEEHARRWPAFQANAKEGFIALPALAALFGTESRHHMLDADYLSTWYPRRAAERRACLEAIAKMSPFWLGTPEPGGEDRAAGDRRA